ncbi:hypothetical protein BDV96DRAFT_602814 [Lophiotrema nucula]|uniref:Uncharacterized protein n=1 Tax=Lophiotrema nucula TaxID=690887 RepID=A0A6A5YYV6_9PLEO|nr:hypothetical protein BDV96DRAFT_602814 [Lophiotrema nucula]
MSAVVYALDHSSHGDTAAREALLDQVAATFHHRLRPADKQALREILSRFCVEFPPPNGPPVSLDRAFYFSCEHEDFPIYYPVYNTIRDSQPGTPTNIDEDDVPRSGYKADVDLVSDGPLQPYRSSAPSPPSSYKRETPSELTPTREDITPSSPSPQCVLTPRDRSLSSVTLAAHSSSRPIASIEPTTLELSVTGPGPKDPTYVPDAYYDSDMTPSEIDYDRALSEKYASEPSNHADLYDEESELPDEERFEGAESTIEQSIKKEEGRNGDDDVIFIKSVPRSSQAQTTQDSGVADMDRRSPSPKRSREEFEAEIKIEGGAGADEGPERKRSRSR